MGWLDWARNKTARKTPGSALPDLGWDFHCHLVPGVDDGARDLDEALHTIEALRAQGYRGAVVTPHIYGGVFDNDASRLRETFAELQRAVEGRFELQLAAEYHANDLLFELIERDELLHTEIGRERCVLVEFPYLMEAPRGMDALVALRSTGYRPILAHVERYRYVQARVEPWLERLRQLGVLVQCNIGSLAGMYGQGPQQLARQLLAEGVPDLWGSDVHRPQQVQRYITPGLRLLAPKGALNPGVRPEPQRKAA